MRIRSFLGIVSIGIALAVIGEAHAQNLVQDPGFEASTGVFSNPFWIIGSADAAYFEDCSGCNVVNSTTNNGPYNGDWYVAFPATTVDSAFGSAVTQVIPTVAGATYLVSFFLANDSGPDNFFQATLGDQTVLSLSEANAFNYQQFSALVTATSDNATLSFVGEQVPAAFFLDDVSVTLEQGAPAPTVGGGVISFAVAFAGLIGGYLRRRPT